jgi:hypothetical protein
MPADGRPGLACRSIVSATGACPQVLRAVQRSRWCCPPARARAVRRRVPGPPEGRRSEDPLFVIVVLIRLPAET